MPLYPKTSSEVERIIGKVTEDLSTGKGLFEPLTTRGA
jgi:hypothetical protein